MGSRRRMTGPRLYIVRPGQSAHTHSGWIDSAGFSAWRKLYEVAGIDPSDSPPPERVRIAARAGVIGARDVLRAQQSAQRLYERFGFAVVGEPEGGSVTMVKRFVPEDAVWFGPCRGMRFYIIYN